MPPLGPVEVRDKWDATHNSAVALSGDCVGQSLLHTQDTTKTRVGTSSGQLPLYGFTSTCACCAFSVVALLSSASANSYHDHAHAQSSQRLKWRIHHKQVGAKLVITSEGEVGGLASAESRQDEVGEPLSSAVASACSKSAGRERESLLGRSPSAGDRSARLNVSGTSAVDGGGSDL